MPRRDDPALDDSLDPDAPPCEPEAAAEARARAVAAAPITAGSFSADPSLLDPSLMTGLNAVGYSVALSWRDALVAMEPLPPLWLDLTDLAPTVEAAPARLGGAGCECALAKDGATDPGPAAVRNDASDVDGPAALRYDAVVAVAPPGAADLSDALAPPPVADLNDAAMAERNDDPDARPPPVPDPVPAPLPLPLTLAALPPAGAGAAAAAEPPADLSEPPCALLNDASLAASERGVPNCSSPDVYSLESSLEGDGGASRAALAPAAPAPPVVRTDEGALGTIGKERGKASAGAMGSTMTRLAGWMGGWLVG